MRNATERAIQTFKSHFISILCGTNKNFPINLWDKFVPQATLTLNLLRTSRLNPNLSAYSQIYGSFDFNRIPIAPLGTKLLIYEKLGPRASWSPHAKNGWYIGPALRHYRCFNVWATTTNTERIADTIVLFPENYFMSQATQLDSAAVAAYELTQALIRPRPKPTDRKAIYLKIVVELKPHKVGNHRVRFTVGGNRIDYPGIVTTPTAEMQTVKLHLNKTV